MTERYRNHPIVIARGLVGSVMILAILIFNVYINVDDKAELSEVLPYAPVLLVVPIVMILYTFIWWKRTYITIEEDHAVAESRIISSKVKVIPYGKVASVNEVRGLVGRIIGCTTLQINVNSAHNAARPELSFTFKDELAQYVSKTLKHGLSSKSEEPAATDAVEDEEIETVPEEDMGECLYRFGMTDAIMYGVFGANTWSLLATLFFGAYSVFSTFFTGSVGLIAIIMMILSGIIPMVSTIIRHGDFRVYRNGDRIRLRHGMVTIYDTSFDISKVNAVSIKRTLFARMIHKCCLEAEVVGINALNNEVTPAVTLLIPEKDVDKAIGNLFPDFAIDYEVEKQPRKAFLPHLVKATIISALWIAVFAALTYTFWKYDPEFDKIDSAILHAFMITVPILAYAYHIFAYRMHGIGYGERMFTTVTGVVDVRVNTMKYEKVQIFNTVATPMIRRKGLAKASFSLLSAAGAKSISICYFPEKELESIGTKAVEQSPVKRIQ